MRAEFIPIDTKSSWSAAAGIDWVKAGVERIFCSTICMSAVYWLSIIPENIPAHLVRKAGRPALRAGLVRRFIRRSESTQIMVTAPPRVSSGMLTGVPWKLAPVRTTPSSGRKIGLSPTPLASISSCSLVHRIWSRAAPITCGEERIE